MLYVYLMSFGVCTVMAPRCLMVPVCRLFLDPTLFIIFSQNFIWMLSACKKHTNVHIQGRRTANGWNLRYNSNTYERRLL